MNRRKFLGDSVRSSAFIAAFSYKPDKEALINQKRTSFYGENGKADDSRIIPEIPEKGQKIRLLIDSDCACEIDDQYAIALALLSSERFEIEGFVGAHFGDAGGPGGIEKSVNAIKDVIAAAGMEGKFIVKKGSHPFRYSVEPAASEGVDFIIERALDQRKNGPLWVISLGACTNLAAACLKEPAIKNKVIALWHGRTQWPEKCWNFNVYNDLKAARILFQSEIPLILFDTGTGLVMTMEESSKRIMPHGRLGNFLHEIRVKLKWTQDPGKGIFDLGDIAAIADASLISSEIVPVPDINWDMMYDHNHTHGNMLRIYSIDRDRTFSLLESKLSEHNKA